MSELVQGVESKHARRAIEARSAAYLEAALDCVVMADSSGRIVEFNPAAQRTFGYTRDEAIGQTIAELIVPPSLRERHRRAFARFAETGKEKLFGRRLELTGMRSDGSEFPIELTLSRVEGEPSLVCGALRDITEVKRAADDLRRLADEQAALRRVATLVARGASAGEIFARVAEEVAHVLDVPLIGMARYELDGTSTLIGAWGSENPMFRPGIRVPPHPGLWAEVRRTGRPARVENYGTVGGAVSARLRAAGVQAGIGVPIVVDGMAWGVISALSTAQKTLPDDIEDRLVNFTELVATAISNTQARDDLRRLADEQAALRRVATLVAREPRPADVFAAVVKEAARLLHSPLISMVRYEPDGTATVIAALDDRPFPVGSNWPLDGPSIIATVLQTRRSARVDDYAGLPGMIAARVREAGIRSAVGVPIAVDRKTWGAMVAVAPGTQPLPDDTESRLADFTELVATAISNMQVRADLRRLADEHAALRRVATVVAQAASPARVFAAVAEEVGQLLEVDVVNIVRHEVDNTAIAVASWSAIGGTIPLGTQLRLDGPSIMGSVSRTGRPARIDSYADVPSAITYVVDGVAIHAGVGVPIVVDGRVWGTVVALTTQPMPLPAGTEQRLAAFTELVATAISNTQARDDLRSLVDEQAALRRLATQVARGADPHEVFDAVCQETGRLLGSSSTNLAQFTPEGFNLTMAGWSLRNTHVPTGTRLPLEGGTVNVLIQRSGKPERVDSYEATSGELAELIRRRGIRLEIGAPVVVDGRVWGALIAGWDTDEPLRAGTESRLASFAELIATAVSNATTRSELISSRARIVAAGDEARRRIERDLHDGTQQQLVSLGLELQALKAKIPVELPEPHQDIQRIDRALDAVLEDVREISQGVHPAIVSHWGLERALRVLARRSAVPVELDVDVANRLPQSTEIAAYYVVSETLANVAKHAHASLVRVTVTASDRRLRAAVCDDGVGGADASGGSGLAGLIDRVQALGGNFVLKSPPGQGTTISIELPLVAETGGE